MLSTLVVTRQIDPDKHDTTGATNTIIELKPEVYLSRLRLINLGASTSGGSEVLYPQNSGVSELIKSIVLKSGNQEIARLNEVGQYMAYKFAHRSDAMQKGVLARTALTEMGAYVEYDTPTNPWSRGWIQQVDWDQDLNEAGDERNEVTLDNLGSLNLNDCLEFLNAMTYLPRIPNLRLVIEWNDLTEANRLWYETRPTSYTINKPQLIVEQVTDPNVLASIPSDFMVEYMNVEVDRQRISKPANTAAINTYKLDLKTFNQKYLKDLMIAVRPDTDTLVVDSGLARNVALAQLNERFTFQIGTSSGIGEYLPPDGIDAPGVKMMMNQASRGALARGLYHFLYAQQGNHKYLAGTKAYQTSRQAYLTLPVEDEINRFQITYRYQARGTENQNQWDASDMFLFGRVGRKMQVQGGRVLLSY